MRFLKLWIVAQDRSQLIGIVRPVQRRGSLSAWPRFDPTLLMRSTVHGAFARALRARAKFFVDDDVIDDGDVLSQVGRKAASKPLPVCFCLGYTASAIAADLTRCGRSTVKESVKDAVAGGLCACEHLNPAGACCLPAIRRKISRGIDSRKSSSTR